MRSYIRHPSDIPIEFRPAPGARIEQEQMTNVSFGGVAFSCSHAVRPGLVLWIRITHVNPVFEAPVRVSWCRPRDGRYEIGVEFLAAEDEYRARMVEQICYIEHYKREVLRTEGRRLSGDQAAREWIEKYAAGFPELTGVLGEG